MRTHQKLCVNGLLAVRVGSKFGGPHTISAPKWIWTAVEEAIALAEEVSADLLLVDDWDARQEAERRHLRAVGTCASLLGASRGLSNIQDTLIV